VTIKKNIHGLLLLDKSTGMTSNQALQKAKKIFHANKAGHTGSLDPLATGMLPICFGEATKVCPYLLDSDKTYQVTAKLGETTDTGDSDGIIINTMPIKKHDSKYWKKTFKQFIGVIDQIPPMYSALKKNGRRLYQLARKGETIDRCPRKITIYKINLLKHFPDRIVFHVHCSKGTYIRTLVEDIARAAGTVAHVIKLHRESVGHFESKNMTDLENLKKIAKIDYESLKSFLLPPETVFMNWPSVRLDSMELNKFLCGQVVKIDEAIKGYVRVYRDDSFFGIGELQETYLLQPRRIFHLNTK
jgi:tRNA pseudouridine55 synthase